MKNYDIGVAIAVPENIKDVSFLIVKQLQSSNVQLTYSLTKDFLPHITLYQGRAVDKIALDSGRKALTEMIRMMQSFKIDMKPELEVRSNGNIFWDVQKSSELSALHEEIAQKMQEFSGGLLIDQSIEALTHATPEEILRIKNFGVMTSGDKYHPHITIARLANTNDLDIINKMTRPQASSFQLQEIFRGMINDYGQMAVKFIDCHFTIV